MEKAFKNRRKMMDGSEYAKKIQKVSNDSFGIYITMEEAIFIFQNSSYIMDDLGLYNLSDEMCSEFIFRFVNLYGQMEFAWKQS